MSLSDQCWVHWVKDEDGQLKILIEKKNLNQLFGGRQEEQDRLGFADRQIGKM